MQIQPDGFKLSIPFDGTDLGGAIEVAHDAALLANVKRARLYIEADAIVVYAETRLHIVDTFPITDWYTTGPTCGGVWRIYEMKIGLWSEKIDDSIGEIVWPDA